MIRRSTQPIRSGKAAAPGRHAGWVRRGFDGPKGSSQVPSAFIVQVVAPGEKAIREPSGHQDGSRFVADAT